MSGKRANIFGQGRPERPYDERDEDASDPPRQATAAQLATRKIKTAKPRRGAAGASIPSQSANFGAPSNFTFGASAPAVGGNNGGMFGATSNAFGGGATNSFPPAQSSAPSNAFSASSFPAFGATGQSTGFNPQPPSATDFNFTAGSGNPFAANNTPAMNGNGISTPPAFGAGFSSQAPSNPFGGLSQNNFSSAAPSNSIFSTSSAPPSNPMFGTSSAPPSNPMFNSSSAAAPNTMFGASSAPPSNNQLNTSSAAPTNNMFGATTGPPSTNVFGASTSNANATSTPASFSFMGASSAAQPPSTPAPSNLFGGFGGAQNNVTPAQNNLFSNFGANAQNGSAPQQEAPQNSFSNAASSAQSTQNTTATATSNTLFGLGATQPSAGTSSAAPPSNMFATAATPSSAPVSNPFSQLPTAAAPSTPSFKFGQDTSQAQSKAPSNPFGAIKLPKDATTTPKPALFNSANASGTSTPAPAETPKINLFGSLKPAPASNTPGINFLGAAQNKDAISKPAALSTEEAPKAAKPNLFSGFSTPQPAKNTDAEKAKAGMYTAQAKSTGNGLFSKTFQPEASNASNAIKTAPKFPAFKPQTPSTAEAPKETTTQSITAKDTSNPYNSLSTPASQRPNLFASQKEQAPTPSSSSMPTLTGSATSSSEATRSQELPKISKAHVPKEWNTAMAPAQEIDSFEIITSLTMQLQQLNENYRSKLSKLQPLADWSSLSLWHYQKSSALKTKIDVAKKQRAAEKGITGNESTLSTKRKVNDKSPENRDGSPTKRARPAEAPATPTPQPSNPPSKFNPPATATSNLFAKAINNKPSAPAQQSDVNAAKTTDAPTPSSKLAQVPGFQPFAGVATPTSIGGFQFNGGSASGKASSSSAPTFKPTVTSGGSGGFASQFAATAKTYEQLAAERKKKAMDEDYDSDEETKAEWSARYDKQEAERIAKEKAAAAAAPTFSLPAFGKTQDASTSKTATFTGQAKPASGASTPAGLFGSRPASPALSTTGSVFDAPSTAQTPSSNIFGHLSSGASSNHQEESEDEGTETSKKDRPTTPPKRKPGASSDEATESNDEEVKRQKQSTSSKGSLLSRMTRSADDGSESEKENNSKTNGTHTPTNKPFAFFDFGAAAGPNSAPAKSDTFAGDQTFKPGTPIKFGEVAATEKKAPPTFQFQAPSTSTTPSKPPPANLFGSSLLAPNAGLSGFGSAPSSTFSSRAATPLSEAENSAASAAEDDDEGGKHEQVDLSKLTAEELTSNDVVFETEQALAKHQVDQGDGTKAWENFARGPLYILKDKVTGKCFVRIRIPSGQTPLNYSILPALKSQVTGSSGKMVQATMPKKEGGIAQFFISLKTKELAKEFSVKYNASLPS